MWKKKGETQKGKIWSLCGTDQSKGSSIGANEIYNKACNDMNREVWEIEIKGDCQRYEWKSTRMVSVPLGRKEVPHRNRANSVREFEKSCPKFSVVKKKKT